MSNSIPLLSNPLDRLHEVFNHLSVPSNRLPTCQHKVIRRQCRRIGNNRCHNIKFRFRNFGFDLFSDMTTPFPSLFWKFQIPTRDFICVSTAFDDRRQEKKRRPAPTDKSPQGSRRKSLQREMTTTRQIVGRNDTGRNRARDSDLCLRNKIQITIR